MKQYLFVGDYDKLPELGYERMPILELFDPQYQMWYKVGDDYSIVIFKHISVRGWSKNESITYSSPELIEPFIKDLIANNMVQLVEDDEEK